MTKTFYITTTLPYVNANPHIGFALEIVFADILSRFHKLLGEEVFFNTGTDEHGQKIYQKAVESGKAPQEYVDAYAENFRQLIPRLGILPEIHFIRTTDTHHKKAAQEFWKKCEAAGDIYKKIYKVKYCVGCELEKTDSELVDGRCPVHPNLEVQLIEEENYFFRFSRYQERLLELYRYEGRETMSFVVPEHRLHEIREFVAGGLKDFSISRLREKMPWGIPVPGDETQVMYVWFDALINYISTLGWTGYEEGTGYRVQGIDNTNFQGGSTPTPYTLHPTPLFNKFWGTEDKPNAVQIAGKDNLRQQSAMWQAMLMSAGLPPSKHIIIHGFINSGGQKMSKSLGNVIDPFAVIDNLIEKGVGESQAIDALRYWFAREMSTFEDGDFTWDKFFESYNANLANGLGNLTSRVLKMASLAGISNFQFPRFNFNPEYSDHLERYEIQKAAEWVWGRIKLLDEYIAKEEPFKVIKIDAEKGKQQIEYLLSELQIIAFHLQPLLPDTAEKILTVLESGEFEGLRLFPRIEL